MPRVSTSSSVSQYNQRQRYRSSAAWSPNDDIQLLNARAQGMTWAAISEQYFPSKGDNACRKHHERLVRRRNDESWDYDKLQAFAAEYWERRKETWQPLAEAMGQKWQFVEEKCLEIGLARLRSAALEAGRHNKHNRRVTGTDDDQDLSDEVDSGIAMEDETEMEVGRRHTSGPHSSSGMGAATASSSRIDAPGSRAYREPATSSNAPTMSPPQPTTSYGFAPPGHSHSQPSMSSHMPPLPPSQSPSVSPQHPSRTLPPPKSTRPPSQGPTIASLLSPSLGSS